MGGRSRAPQPYTNWSAELSDYRLDQLGKMTKASINNDSVYIAPNGNSYTSDQRLTYNHQLSGEYKLRNGVSPSWQADSSWHQKINK